VKGIGVWIIGHRGAAGVAPENTLASFRRAVALGAQCIETDLQLSRDAHLVALHDDTLQRTTNGRGPVSARTLEELKQLDAGSWFRRGPGTERFTGERIPTLQEILAFGREHHLGLFLEMKTLPGSGAENVLVEAIQAADAIAGTRVICFDPGILARVRTLEPRLTLGYLFSKNLRDPAAHAVSAGAKILLPRVDRVTTKLVAAAKRNGLQVVTWTVNDPKKMRNLIALGLDGIITNYPHRLAEVLRAS
jgi:glycerophosphoryl diester phosphodiesterase